MRGKCETKNIVPYMVVQIVAGLIAAAVVLNTATSSTSAGNSYYRLAIGFTLFVGDYAGGAHFWRRL